MISLAIGHGCYGKGGFLDGAEFIVVAPFRGGNVLVARLITDGIKNCIDVIVLIQTHLTSDS